MTTNNSIVSTDTHIEIECKEFLPEVYDTWSYIHKLSKDTINFHEIYDSYKYERSENRQKDYFHQLKILNDTIYKLSFLIHQRILSLEKLVQPALDEFRKSLLIDQQRNSYIPAYIRIVQNQLNSLKLSFKRIITQHNADSIDYQNDLKQSVDNSKIFVESYQQISRVTRDKIKSLFNTDENNIPIESQEQNLIEQETEIVDLETRLESLRILKERVRQMNGMTMALYFSVQEQNELADNIWLNTSAGSDYIAQSVDEFRLVKNLKQSKMNLWIKLICITFCFLLVLIFILILILILNKY
ncbi:unnamed protein product [Adineta steineri]|uniref:t-SNARE coiled-coil homology domain-containing protein n=2 Tax=Adineta steineri TaxID=433720 RepID=A0A813M9N9_9BILA|nr:unnamed protein product [Adineta steineri]